MLSTRPNSLEHDPTEDVLRSHVTASVLVDCQQRDVGLSKQFQEGRVESRVSAWFREGSRLVLHMVPDLERRDTTESTAEKIIQDLDTVACALGRLLRVLPFQHPYYILSAACRSGPVVRVYASHRSAKVWSTTHFSKLKSHRLRFEKVKQVKQQANHSGLRSTFNLD